MAEPLTLYKLMILYLLKKVNYPLSNGQMSEFFVSKSYTDYFTFQMVINELLGTSLIQGNDQKYITLRADKRGRRGALLF